MKYYILERDGEYQVVSCANGGDPLYGYGSWSLAASKGFETMAGAEAAADLVGSLPEALAFAAKANSDN